MARPRLHDDRLRERLLEAATEIIVEHGNDFALRPLAESVGTSTTAIYSLFGSRGALVEAVCVRAGERYAEMLDRIQHEDPLQNLEAAAQFFRFFARKYPSLFWILFTPTLTSPAVRDARALSLRTTAERVQNLVDLGLVFGDPEQTARSLMASCHGFLLLELSGVIGGGTYGDHEYSRHLARLFTGIATPHGHKFLSGYTRTPPLDIITLLGEDITLAM